jgi:hypothetical protein
VWIISIDVFTVLSLVICSSPVYNLFFSSIQSVLLPYSPIPTHLTSSPSQISITARPLALSPSRPLALSPPCPLALSPAYSSLPHTTTATYHETAWVRGARRTLRACGAGRRAPAVRRDWSRAGGRRRRDWRRCRPMGIWRVCGEYMASIRRVCGEYGEYGEYDEYVRILPAASSAS